MRISDWSSDVCSSDLFGRSAGASVGHRFVATSLAHLADREPALIAFTIWPEDGLTFPQPDQPRAHRCQNGYTVCRDIGPPGIDQLHDPHRPARPVDEFNLGVHRDAVVGILAPAVNRGGVASPNKPSADINNVV